MAKTRAGTGKKPRAGAGKTQAPSARAKRGASKASAGKTRARGKKRAETVEEVIRRIRGLPRSGPLKRKVPRRRVSKPKKVGPPKRPPAKPPAPPPGGPEGVRDRIRRMLRSWETKLRQAFPGKPKFVTDVRVFMTSDNHISGELTIDAILRTVSIDRLLLELGIAMHGSELDGGWLSVGFVFPPSAEVEDYELYNRLKGCLSFQTHSRRFTRQLVPYIIQEARRLHEIFRKRRRFRARVVFVKIWWNPEGKRPGHRGKGKRKKR